MPEFKILVDVYCEELFDGNPLWGFETTVQTSELEGTTTKEEAQDLAQQLYERSAIAYLEEIIPMRREQVEQRKRGERVD